MSSYPNEHLVITKSGPYSKWFKSDGKRSTYIPKKDKNRAILLANKKYDACLLEDYTRELALINTFLPKYQALPRKAEQLLQDKAFQSLLSFHPSDMSNTNMHWITEEYEKNPNHPEQLQHKCFSGEYVRSKSEVIIANILFTNQIPYRYECLLSLGGISFYPDFTILNPSTNQMIYWEHFGMMDIPSYSEKAFNKLKHFSRHEIIPGINLITTYETSQHPIDSEQIQQLVSLYFNL